MYHKTINVSDPKNIIREALNDMVDFIKPTYGPSSNKVIISNSLYKMAVDDGVQTAVDYGADTPEKQAICDIVKEVAINTKDRAGDGTTGSLIMLQALYNAGSTRQDTHNLEVELKSALEEAKTQLEKNSKKVATLKELQKVARISFDDKEVADKIAKMWHEIGKDGVALVEKSDITGVQVDRTDGISIDNGYVSPYMVNKQGGVCELENPVVLVTDYKLDKEAHLMSLIQSSVKAGNRNIVVIAEGIEGEALALMLVNKKHGAINPVAVNIPKGTNIQDIAVAFGATPILSTNQDILDDFDVSKLGTCKKIIVSDTNTVITVEDKKEINKHIKDLETQEGNKKEQAVVKKRIAFLNNTFTVVKVGGETEHERKATIKKVENCVSAVQNAMQGGVVAGAGIGLSQIKTSSDVFNQALKQPMIEILENTGNSGAKLKFDKDEALNLVTGERGNFLDVGVIDPTYTLIAGLESAVSIANLLLTTKRMLVEKPEEIIKE